MSSKNRYIIASVGAREHYAAPRAFARAGQLAVFYTEAWCRWGRTLLAKGPALARAFAGRYHPELARAAVVSFNAWEWSRQARERLRPRPGSTEEIHEAFLRFGTAFARKVARRLARRAADPDRDVFMGYTCGSLEALRWARAQGLVSILDQIDPARAEEHIVAEERERWPGWEPAPGRIPEPYWTRVAAEWEEASVVIVNSEWSRKALLEQGVAGRKIVVVPLAYEPDQTPTWREPSRERPLVVLWLGSVILRKGIPYLLEAARRLKATRVRFLVAGGIGISASAVARAPANVAFLGKVDRARASALYSEADVFVLPTLSDGFAITQVEAMAHGLPVIATPHCGEVVRDGTDGFLVPVRDPEAIARAVERLDGDRELLREMSRRALERSRDFSLDAFAGRIDAAVTALRQARR